MICMIPKVNLEVGKWDLCFVIYKFALFTSVLPGDTSDILYTIFVTFVYTIF